LPLLRVKDLRTYFTAEHAALKAVDGVDFDLEPDRTLGIVGESGCGKSITALSIMGLIRPPGKVVGGQILYNRKGEIIDLATLDLKGPEFRAIRGNDIAMIFQEPMTSLNPVFTIGNQIMEPLRVHQGMNKAQARERAVEMLDRVGIPMPRQRAGEYPHQLSGGMRQRAMIAMALSCNPSLLIADEPTTALDVTIQAQVLDLMADLRRELKTSIIMITHNLGVVAGFTDDMLVMYLGKVVESGPVREVFQAPAHPYTQGLLNSAPSVAADQAELSPIEGVVPDLLHIPAGCGFVTRCRQATDRCHMEMPPSVEITPGHRVSCWKENQRGNP
jgi:oligopeptide/dipeptide ABC transporter ATP-binding protein